jgi:steroid delta-isomerase-like uncharacterized protein
LVVDILATHRDALRWAKEGKVTSRDVFEKFVERLDGRDYERAGELLYDDCELVHAASVRGRGQAVGFFEASLRAFPDSHHVLQSWIEGPEGVAVERTWQGTHSEVMSTPMGDLPPSGRTAAVPFVAVVRVNDGRIASLHLYSDQVSLMTQLGLISAPSS